MQNTALAPIMPLCDVVGSRVGMFDAANGSESQNPIESKLYSEHGALVVI